MKGFRADDRNLGRRIRERRETLGLSQRAVTAGASFTYAYLSRIENGTRTPSLGVLVELAGRLQTSAATLAFGHDPAVCPFCGNAKRRRS